MIRVEVIIPLALDGLFSYAVPEVLISEAPGFSVGCRVVVPFGGKRYYTGVVFSMDKEAEVTACKEVEQILDATPIIPEAMLKQWEWMAYYYACPLGSILRDALPSGLLPESKTKIAGELRTIAWLEHLLCIYRSQLNEMEERTGESSADKSLQLLRRHLPLLGKCI